MPQTIETESYRGPVPDYDAMLHNLFGCWHDMSIGQQSTLQYYSAKAHWDMQDRAEFEKLYYSFFERVH